LCIAPVQRSFRYNPRAPAFRLRGPHVEALGLRPSTERRTNEVRTEVVAVVYETEVHKSGTEFSVSPKALRALDLPEDSDAVPHDIWLHLEVERLAGGKSVGPEVEKLTSGREIRWHGEPFEPHEPIRVTLSREQG
jgi:hypothetical protein